MADRPTRAAASPRRRALTHAGLALAIMLGTVLVATLLNHRVVTAIEQSRQLVGRANAQAEAVRQVVEALKDIETGERGFLLTATPAYLQPYEAGQAQLEAALRRLDTLADQSPAVRDALLTLGALAHQKVAQASRVVAMAQGQDRDAAIAETLTGSGKATMDEVRDRAAAILGRIGEEHERLLREVRRREAWASRAGVATAAVCAALLGFAVLVLLRGRARLQRAQAALGAQTARLSGTLAQLRDGVAVVGRDGDLLLWNAQFATLADVSEDLLHEGEAIERIMARAWPGAPPAAAAVLPGLQEIRAGQQTFELWRGPMPDDGQILVVAETTRRTRAEAIARQAQKMEALGQLTGGVAHDFNNLLQVMSANLELIARRMGGNVAMADRLAATLGAVERASQLTRHLLAFARRQPLAPEAIDTIRLLTGLEDMLRRTLGEVILLHFVLPPDLWPIQADPQQLETAILNLAINARDAMEGAGSLTVEAANVDLDADYAARAAEVTPGQYVAIAITDTGIGMTPEQLGRALEPFYTTKPEGRGTGLGLPMVFGFAKQSSGHLQLYSEPGHGTTVRLYLPRSRTLPLAPAEPAAPPEQASGELVLIVEDDATVRAASDQALRDLGYRVAEAASAGQALALLRDGLRPDLLFTDVVMPGRPDARTMAEQARRLIPGLAVVYTSGYTENAVVHHGRLDRSVILVSKPWRTADLAMRLRQALTAARALAAARTLRIILAEDDPLVRMTTTELLIELGHQVTDTASGAEALAALRPECGLLITDLGLPDMDGLELATRARAAQPGLPVVVSSGRDCDPTSRHVWLEKPFDAASLRRAIERALTAPADVS